MWPYMTMEQQATERAKAKLSQASSFRAAGKPERWARDCEVKALRAFERSFWLRHWGDFGEVPPRPAFLPPATYCSK